MKSKWLVLGLALTFAAHLRWGAGALAWVAPIPLLYFLRETSGVRSRAIFAAALIATWIAITTKIVTGPLPWMAALGFGVGIGAIQSVGYIGAEIVRLRVPSQARSLVFPAVMVTLEWAQHRFTPLGTWGAAANTQLWDRPLLQIASIFGMAGVSFLVYWLASALVHREVRAAVATIALAHVFGAVRMDRSLSDRTTAAAIGTLATFDGHAMPTDEDRARTLEALLSDTRAASRTGAKIAVWTEAAALVMPAEEEAFTARVSEVAREAHIQIVAAYIVPMSATSFENKYRWFRADGGLDHTYFKHHPVPGEPARVGTSAIDAQTTELGVVSGAICYDYDFPSLSHEHGRLGVDLVALPSSDWRGIDPIHTEMASLRAIEEGTSIIRSTRFGLTAGIDPFGRMVSQRSSWESSDRVLVFDLPRHGIETVHRTIGDALVYASMVFLLSVLALRRWGSARALRLAT